MTPTLVLTRPEAQSREIEAAFAGQARVIVSPVMRIVAAGKDPDLARYRGVILTSANAAPFAPDLTGKPAYCVGARTAEAARSAGALVTLVAQSADDLVARLEATGPLLHLRGEHARGAVAERLNLAGIDTDTAVIYRQEALPLSAEAQAALAGDARVVLPLYSPRTASLVGAGINQPGRLVQAIAMSPAVAEVWRAETGQVAETCAQPTGTEMRARIEAALRG